jgi:hypothetical protein
MNYECHHCYGCFQSSGEYQRHQRTVEHERWDASHEAQKARAHDAADLRSARDDLVVLLGELS